MIVTDQWRGLLVIGQQAHLEAVFVVVCADGLAGSGGLFG